MISARVKIQCSGKTQVGKEFGESKAEGRLTCQPQKPECLMRMMSPPLETRGPECLSDPMSLCSTTRTGVSSGPSTGFRSQSTRRMI